jgi:hypothetical protein
LISYNEVRVLQPESCYVFSYAVCLGDPVSEISILEFHPFGLWAAT